MHCACNAGFLDICEFLINSGARVNEITDSFTIPFHYLVRKSSSDELWQKHAEVLMLMLKEGADINARDIHLQTPLHRSCSQGRDERCVRFLLDNGAKINAMDEFVFFLFLLFQFYFF